MLSKIGNGYSLAVFTGSIFRIAKQSEYFQAVIRL